MRNLYVVESPLQALCALEICLGKEGEINIIVVKISNGTRTRNDKQILKVISKGNWTNIITLKPYKYSNYFTKKIDDLLYLSLIEKKFKYNISNLYIGEFRSSFMHMVRTAIRSSNTFLLDDGAVTVKIINKYIEKNNYYNYDMFYPKGIIKKTLYRAIYKKYIDVDFMKRELKVITAFFNKENTKVEKISYSNIKGLGIDDKSTDDSVVYYYGSKYSEVGIISRDYEMLFLAGINNYYHKKNKKVLYFAHRDESKEKLDFITEKIGFTIVMSDVTAELYLLESETMPSEICGAYTSVLNNIKVIYPNIEVKSFKILSNQIKVKWRNDIENVYDYYKEIGIPVQNMRS